MLHVRVISPGPLTDDVVAMIRADPGTTNLVRLTGAALDPAGDLVQVDVAREALDALITRLLDLGLPQHGSIVVLEVDTAMGADVERADLVEVVLLGDGGRELVRVPF